MANNARFFSGLQRWQSAIQGLSTLTASAAKDVAVQLTADTQQNYRKQRDPYGKKWKKRKHKHDHPILNRTGFLFSRLKVRVRGKDTLVATNDASYAIYHQVGTRTLAVRLILPTGRQGLPEGWRKLIVKAIERRWKQNFARKGIR